MVKTARSYVLASSDAGLFPNATSTQFYFGTQGINREYANGRCIEAIFPNTIYQINPVNNTFSFTEETGNIDLTITLTNGTYTNTDFSVMMKSLLDAESLANGNSLVYNVAINQNNGLLEISASGNFRVNVANSSEITGFNTQTGFGASNISQSVVNLTPIDTILIHGLGSNLFNCIENTQDDIFMVVPLAQFPFGSYCHYAPENPLVFPSPRTDQMYVKLTDEKSRDVFINSNDGVKLLIEFFDS